MPTPTNFRTSAETDERGYPKYVQQIDVIEVFLEERANGGRMITDFDNQGRLPIGPKCPTCQLSLQHAPDCTS